MSELTRARQRGRRGTDAQVGKQLHDRLATELATGSPEVLFLTILPGGSRPSGLASIAESTGVTEQDWLGNHPVLDGVASPPQIQVRAWVERTRGQVSVDDITRVTVGLADPRSGASIATKTLAAENLDAAAAAVAGYVARHIFARDRTLPPWSASATDGADLAALLRARQVRAYPESRSGIRSAWKRQIEILEAVATETCAPASSGTSWRNCTTSPAGMSKRCCCTPPTGSSIRASTADATASPCPWRCSRIPIACSLRPT
jgi:hypothetical protein